MLPIAPSTYYARQEPAALGPRALRDEELTARDPPGVRRRTTGVYGVRKVWRQLHREGIAVARCTVERLMRELGLAGRGAGQDAPHHDPGRGRAAAGRPGRARLRARRAPNRLWVADLTYVRHLVRVRLRRVRHRRLLAADRRLAGVAARCAPTWPWTPWRWRSGHARPATSAAWCTTATAGVQYLSIRYTERLAEAGAVTSVGSRGDAYDNALAESIIGLYKTELIRQHGPWRNLDDVEFATLEWVDWFNHRRLLEPIGNIPPAEFEEEYYRQATSRRGSTQTTESPLNPGRFKNGASAVIARSAPADHESAPRAPLARESHGIP